MKDGTGKAEAAKLQDAGISLKQCPEKMSGRKRLAYGTRKIGVAPAETSGQVKRTRKSQLCDDHHRFENGGRFEGLPRFAAVTSGIVLFVGSTSSPLSNPRRLLLRLKC